MKNPPTLFGSPTLPCLSFIRAHYMLRFLYCEVELTDCIPITFDKLKYQISERFNLDSHLFLMSMFSEFLYRDTKLHNPIRISMCIIGHAWFFILYITFNKLLRCGPDPTLIPRFGLHALSFRFGYVRSLRTRVNIGGFQNCPTLIHWLYLDD